MFTSEELARGKRQARATAEQLHYRAFLVVRGSELVCTLVPQAGDVPIFRAGLDYLPYSAPQPFVPKPCAPPRRPTLFD